ncbi:MAG TPA: hypothetical protein VFF64_26180 [Candidatus Eremiobacteraceae bacterium]|nr:hypothetical protein [Candidatus Eremiobacteraceae bacterium]
MLKETPQKLLVISGTGLNESRDGKDDCKQYSCTFQSVSAEEMPQCVHCPDQILE